MEAETRPSLLFRLRDVGDERAWEQFVHTYGPLVYRSARRRGLSHVDAEDVAQRVFTRVLNGIRGFEYDPQRGRFRDWLGTIIRNEVFRLAKQESHTPHASGDTLLAVESPGEEAEWVSEFQAHVLAIALETCRPHFEAETWEAFEAVWRRHEAATAVAASLGRPVDWVYVAKSRVLKRLWTTVSELTDDMPLPGPAGA